MPTPSQIVEAQAMNLPPQERAELAERLWLSVHSKEEVDDAWDAEVARRIREIDAGEAQTVAWSTVMTELRAKLD